MGPDDAVVTGVRAAFANAGYREPHVLPAEPSPAAARLA